MAYSSDNPPIATQRPTPLNQTLSPFHPPISRFAGRGWLDELPGASGAAAELAQDVPGLERGWRARRERPAVRGEVGLLRRFVVR
jgi:hypothetical protein